MHVLTKEQVDEACVRYQGGESCAALGAFYGVAPSSIWGHLKRRSIRRRIQTEAQLIDMVGRIFGRLRVLRQDGFSAGRQALWLCRCKCGTEKTVNGSSLRRGDIVSCGCFLQERRTRHGLCKTVGYKLLESAKGRAKRLGIEFSLTLSGIDIPEFCPVLGIRLRLSPENGKVADDSPTLDRIDPKLGYIVGNVAVVSHRANSIKRSASIWELEQVIVYMRNHGLGISHESHREVVSGIPRL